MTKADWLRLWLHFPWGFIAFLIYTQDKVGGLAVLACELIYEAFNDWQKNDKSYKDVLGIVWGFMVPLVILAILALLRVLPPTLPLPPGS